MKQFEQESYIIYDRLRSNPDATNEEIMELIRKELAIICERERYKGIRYTLSRIRNKCQGIEIEMDNNII